MALQSGINLEPGENLVMEIEAELWASSSNPIAQAIGAIKRIFAAIFGFKVKGFWVITDKRVVEVAVQVACYVFTVGRQVKFILPSSVKEIGYTRETTCGCFCPMYKLYYEGFTQLSSVQLKGADEAAAMKAANSFYNAICAANK
jgi:hypothetical protein